ncbi:hypothetical protein KIMH_04860 [Bombiscardovia apis]|uniref:Uncharacterized protein n=1 Tax=Bombiscardovia apis TaxID=2932182 RepID=A0ABM8BBT4_9BIFI|nr:hypothetical protein [Bombiscardovia apis]BDR54375.1 hypothetical protein KIMH_04860 [Bombiscardovia apis]
MSENSNDSALPAGGADGHLSDEEIERALADFEREMQSGQGSASGQELGQGPSEAALDAESTDRLQSTDAAGANGIDPLAAGSFDEELEGLIGNRAKAALIVTRLASAELLSAFCQISDISALCVDAPEGAVALLKNLDGDGPEAAVKDLTTVVSGLSAMLVVNRADKLEAKLWIEGRSGQSFPPPMVFASSADFVEDLLIGTSDVELLKVQGFTLFDSGSLDRAKAMGIIAEHTRFNRGGKPKGGRIE